MSFSFQDLGNSPDYTSTDADTLDTSEYKQVLLQQSVTMLAYMDRSFRNITNSSGSYEPRMLLGFSLHDIPILIGAAVGAAGLILMLLTAVVIWHCCRFRRRHDKAYCLDNSTPDDTFSKQNNGSIAQSDSVVFLGSKYNQVTTRIMDAGRDVCQTTLTRSQSVPLKEANDAVVPPKIERKISKKRPTSQPIQACGRFPSVNSSKHMHQQQYFQHLVDVTNYEKYAGLPSIPEMAKSSETLQDVPPLTLYASCNALDGPCIYSSLYSKVDTGATMKTRSLPLWGRSRPRPLSTADDLNELYAKVSFSKKRKNRMRSDSAAAIAANKSKTTYLTLPFTHKDTDSLVDNEATVVYDERTAL